MLSYKDGRAEDLQSLSRSTHGAWNLMPAELRGCLEIAARSEIAEN